MHWLRMRSLGLSVSLRASARCSSGSSNGSGIATSNRSWSWRGRTWSPFVAALTHSRKLYRTGVAIIPTTPPSATVAPAIAVLGSFGNSNSFTPTFTPPLPSTSYRTSSPTTTPGPGTFRLLRARPHPGSRRLFLSTDISRRFYSPQSTTTHKASLPIMYEGKWTALTVRKTFFDYFAERGHTIGMISSLKMLSRYTHRPPN